MIIFLTGKPGIGKSTLIEKIIKSYPDKKSWVVTQEIREEGQRIGFLAENSRGNQRVISHKTKIKSAIVVGANWVDLEAINEVFLTAISQIPQGGLLILDELGPIQLKSADFTDALDDLLKKEVDILSTIHINAPEVEKYKSIPGSILIDVTDENRDKLEEIIFIALNNADSFNKLSLSQKVYVSCLTQKYLSKNQFLQVKKLFNNAITYVAEDKVEKTNNAGYKVVGKHGNYYLKDKYTCECDLFCGRGKYQEEQGECSHIQAAKIIEN